MNTSPSYANKSAAPKQEPLLPAGVGQCFALVTFLFLLWGVPGNLNDILIKQFMKSFAMSRFEVGLVQTAYYLGYFILAIPAGLLMKRRGYKAGLVTGLVLFGTGCFLFVPAAHSGQFVFFLGALFVIASGATFLETGANPFIAQLGPESSSERRLNISQAFNPIGASLGVLVGTKFILSGVELDPAQISAMQAAGTYAAYLHSETLRVIVPYLVLGSIAFIWAFLLATTRFPAVLAAEEEVAEHSGSVGQLLSQKHFLFALLAQFLYVGAQVGTWSYFIQYAQDYTHVHERIAGYLLVGTLGAFGIGRFTSAVLMRVVSPGKLMAAYSLVNVGLVLTGVLHPGMIGMLAIFVSSFFMSLMFPTIFALGLKILGPNTKLGGSLLVMTVVGGAVIPPLMGLVAQSRGGMAPAYGVVLFCYVVIAAFSFYMARYQQREVSS